MSRRFGCCIASGHYAAWLQVGTQSSAIVDRRAVQGQWARHLQALLIGRAAGFKEIDPVWLTRCRASSGLTQPA
jgi:hypothetical protein